MNLPRPTRLPRLVFAALAGLCCGRLLGAPVPEVEGLRLASDTLPAGVTRIDDAARGSVLHFSGDRSRIEFAPLEAIERLHRCFTLSLWMKLDRAPGGSTAPVLTKRSGWWTGKPYSINVRGDGLLEAVIHDGSDHWLHGQPTPIGTWQHVALVVGESEVVLYQNGKAVNRCSYAGRLRMNAERLALGSEEGGNFPGGDYRAFPGSVAGVQVFAAPLSPDDVTALHANRLAIRPATPQDFPTRGLLPHEIPDSLRQPADPNAPLEAFIDFSSESPRAVGMTFDRTGTRATTADVEGRKDPCWAAIQGSSLQPWERAWRFTLTDERFRHGRMPAVDVEIEYLLPAWAGIQVVADTATGSRQVAGGWQATRWQTLRFRIDDAFFGARDFGSPESAHASDGFDLCIHGSTSDLFLRSIRIRGYDRTANPDFKRLLKLQSISSPNDIFLTAAGKPVELHYAFTNLALRPVDVRAHFSWELHNGTAIGQRDARLTLPPSASATLPLSFTTTDLPLGVCVVHARFSTLAPQTETPEPLYERTTYVGIARPGKLDKAAPGEFLYGLDTSLEPAARNPRVLRWCDALGVDIVRAGYSLRNGSAEIETLRPHYRAHGLRTQVMLDIPWDDNPERLRDRLAETAQHAASLATRYPDDLLYWELGNEPDLTFFYKGPIDVYAAGYESVSRALHKANPKAVVMNGGLCFAGHEADTRARRFVELVDPTTIGAWAYHGHGPGARAEREALERIRSLVEKHGKGGKPFIETESGFAAGTRAQEIVQARTCVQKFVYAQSENLPLMMWFRLIMSEEDYGTLRGDAEPRPAALAYRALVQALRHHRFVRTLDLGLDHTEAYLFENTATHTYRLVAWRTSAGQSSALLLLPKARNLALLDLFGNRTTPTLGAGDTLRLTPTEDPLILAWDSATTTSTPIDIVPPLLSLAPYGPFEPNTRATLPLRINNSLPHDLHATLHIEADPRLPLPTPPTDLTLTPLRKGETRSLALHLDFATPHPPINWPRGWLVFPDSDLDLRGLTQPPTLGGIAVPMTERGIDLTTLNVTYREKRPATAFAIVHAAVPCTVTMGASADWWMDWYVNGQPIYNTLTTGNAGAQTKNTHTFDIPLKAGDNLLSVKILSGSQGWRFLVGSPDELASLSTGRPLQPGLTLTLRGPDNAPLATRFAPIEFVPEIPSRPQPAPLDHAAWQRLLPTAHLGPDHIQNDYQKEPDATRWYRGETDLSATLWLADTPNATILDLAVTDDHTTFLPNVACERLDLALQTPDTTHRWHIIPFDDRTPAITPLTDNAPTLTATTQKTPTGYLLRLTLPRSPTFTLTLDLTDTDNGLQKQRLHWTSQFRTPPTKNTGYPTPKKQ